MNNTGWLVYRPKRTNSMWRKALHPTIRPQVSLLWLPSLIKIKLEIEFFILVRFGVFWAWLYKVETEAPNHMSSVRTRFPNYFFYKQFSFQKTEFQTHNCLGCCKITQLPNTTASSMAPLFLFLPNKLTGKQTAGLWDLGVIKIKPQTSLAKHTLRNVLWFGQYFLCCALFLLFFTP